MELTHAAKLAGNKMPDHVLSALDAQASACLDEIVMTNRQEWQFNGTTDALEAATETFSKDFFADLINSGLFGGVVFQTGKRAESIRFGTAIENEAGNRRRRRSRDDEEDDRSQEGLGNSKSLLWKKERDGSYRKMVEGKVEHYHKTAWADPKPQKPTKQGLPVPIAEPPTNVKGPLAVHHSGIKVAGDEWDLAVAMSLKGRR